MRLQVGFSHAHARRARIATNLAGVPQAIEWALAHLDEESDAQGAQRQLRSVSALCETNLRLESGCLPLHACLEARSLNPIPQPRTKP